MTEYERIIRRRNQGVLNLCESWDELTEQIGERFPDPAVQAWLLEIRQHVADVREDTRRAEALPAPGPQRSVTTVSRVAPDLDWFKFCVIIGVAGTLFGLVVSLLSR